MKKDNYKMKFADFITARIIIPEVYEYPEMKANDEK